MRWFISLVVLALGFATIRLWHVYQGPIGAELAAQQVQDDSTAFAIHQAVNYGDAISLTVYAIVAIILLLIWGPAIKAAMKNSTG